MPSHASEMVGVRSGEPGLADDLRTLFRAFSCRRRLIASIVATFLLIGLGFVWVSAPAYTSSVDIFVDPRERNLVDLGVTPTGLGSSSQGADAALVESQIAILGSRAVLGALIEREKLELDPEFNGTATGVGAMLRDGVKALVYGPNVADHTHASRFDRALARLERVVKVKRVSQTYVLNISVTTGSANRSARLANALAAIYLGEGQTAADDSALEAARSLEARLAELRDASEKSQRAVEDYRRDNGLMGVQGVLVDERRLAELSAQAVAASVATQSARVVLEGLRRGDADAVVSEVATRLRIQIEQARLEEQAIAGTYGTRHPRLAPAREARISLERALEAEIARIVARAESDHRNAETRQASLEAMLAQSEDRLARSKAASVKLRELEQIAERDRSLHDAFATRAKKAREQIALPITTARILSAAEPASVPSEPRLAVVFGVCLFLGVTVGFGAAWLMWLFRGPPVPAASAAASAAARRPVAAR
jgi:uncharacterized protein involved in exopolysaccharide biosynthesis